MRTPPEQRHLSLENTVIIHTPEVAAWYSGEEVSPRHFINMHLKILKACLKQTSQIKLATCLGYML